MVLSPSSGSHDFLGPSTPPGELVQMLLRLRLQDLERRLSDMAQALWRRRAELERGHESDPAAESGPPEAPDSAALAEVRAAIERFSKGRFGLCTDCGEPVETDRLLLRPQVRQCGRCEAASRAGAWSRRAETDPDLQ
jgi:hypothetical protein